MNRSFSAMPFAVGLLLFMIAIGLLALPFDPGFLAVANAAVPAAGASSAAAPQLPGSGCSWPKCWPGGLAMAAQCCW